jgi:hypothetical protein
MDFLESTGSLPWTTKLCREFLLCGSKVRQENDRKHFRALPRLYVVRRSGIYGVRHTDVGILGIKHRTDHAKAKLWLCSVQSKDEHSHCLLVQRSAGWT